MSQRTFYFLWILTLLSFNAQADRLKSYSGWNSALRGDSMTVGMGGAAFVIPNSISSSAYNPAGIGMSMESVSAQINRYELRDTFINRSGKSTSETQGGLSIASPPYGFGISWFTPMNESGTYLRKNSLSAFEAQYEKVQLSETHFSFSRILIPDRLSLGVSAILLKANYEIDSERTSALKMTPNFGVLYNFYKRNFLGISFRPRAVLIPDHQIGNSTNPGFSQPVKVPSLLSFGAGWVPNRYFRTGFYLMIPFKEKNSALLADESIKAGEKTSFQPHLGMSYVLAEYKNLKIEASLGSYLENNRYSNEPSRFHKTAAFDINPYFFNTSIGIDIARNFKNKIFSVGIDIVRVSRFLDLIPENKVKPLNKVLPDPLLDSSEGLPSGMNSQNKVEETGTSLEEVKNIILELPEKIKNKFNNPTEVNPPVIAPSVKPSKKIRKNIRKKTTR